MNIYDFLFIVQFLVLISIILVKLYNIFSIGEFYDMRIGFLLFIGYFIAWFVGFSIFMFQPERLIYSMLFKFGNLFLVFNMLFLFIEILLMLMANTRKVVTAHKAAGYKG